MKITKRHLAALVAIGSLSAGSITVWAHDGASSDDGTIDNAKITHAHHDAQHGGVEGHLPSGSTPNVQLVSKLALKNVVPEKIADVGVHKGYAYLGAWGVVTCKYNGVHVVDIRNPATPKEVAFIGSKEGSYPGEGVQALSISTPSFTGDILVTNNEKCNDNAGFGGFNIYDVTNPAHPTPLTEGYGDSTVNGQGKKAANETHSVFAWDAGAKAYAVIVDNEEGRDVDIIDITNPKKPKLIREYDLDEEFPQIVQAAPSNLVQIFLHDMVVKEIGGRQIMLLSYWDGGYVKLDVTDPANATYLADSDFDLVDPELLAQTGSSEVPEGNAHQSEFTLDNQYIIAADEDFSPTGFEATTNDGSEFLAIPGSGTAPIEVGVTLTGQTKYVGRACDGDPAVPAAGVGQIAVVVRGLCTFTEKIANVEEAAGGYLGAIIVNREGADGCTAFGMSVEGTIPAVSIDREAGYGLFDLAGYNESACLAGAASDLPGVTIGDLGDSVDLRSFFDGWGYVHLYSNDGVGKLDELDTYAIPEAMDPDNAEGVGDLSVHEVATSLVDPALAYISYYSGGFRVVRIVDGELVEVGKFIDEGGNNFWGVQAFIGADGDEYVAASDRDHGLYIFKVTP